MGFQDFENFKHLLHSSKTKSPKSYAKKVIEEVDYYLLKQKQTKQKDLPLSDYVYERYGNGYLFFINEDRVGHVEFPEDYKYFHGGWWMDSQNAWFFKKDQLESIIAKGAILLDDYNKMKESSTQHHSEDLDEMSYDSDSVSSHHDDDSDYVPEDEESDLDEMSDDDHEEDLILNGLVTYKKYGKGWLVTPKKSCDVAGQKYLNGGWWMPSKGGWFFKDREFAALGL